MPTTPSSVHAKINMQRVPQVIIIPIYWNKRAEEKAAVLAAAERAAAVLRRGGLTAALDASDERMPGAKFKHWCVPCSSWECVNCTSLSLVYNTEAHKGAGHLIKLPQMRTAYCQW